MNTQIFRNFDRRLFQDSAGKTVNTLPEVAYPNKPVWEIVYRKRDNTAKDMSSVVSWRAAVDVDFTVVTDPMCRSTPAMISTAELAGETTIYVSLDADNAPFLAAVTGRTGGVRLVYFELEGYGADGDSCFYDIFPCIARMPMDPQGATSPPLAQVAVWASKAWCYAMFGPRGVYYTGDVDCTAEAETTVYTVKILADFIAEMFYGLRKSITGSGAPHSFKLMADDVEVIADHVSIHDDADNSLDREMIAIRQFFPAGTILKVIITSASTYTTHTTKFILRGIVAETGSLTGPTDETPAPVQVPDQNGGIWQLGAVASGSGETEVIETSWKKTT